MRTAITFLAIWAVTMAAVVLLAGCQNGGRTVHIEVKTDGSFVGDYTSGSDAKIQNLDITAPGGWHLKLEGADINSSNANGQMAQYGMYGANVMGGVIQRALNLVPGSGAPVEVPPVPGLPTPTPTTWPSTQPAK